MQSAACQAEMKEVKSGEVLGEVSEDWVVGCEVSEGGHLGVVFLGVTKYEITCKKIIYLLCSLEGVIQPRSIIRQFWGQTAAFRCSESPVLPALPWLQEPDGFIGKIGTP